MERPSDLIQSVSRAFRILEEVGRHPDGINPKRVAQRCGMHLSTAYHLLRTLCYEGYLIRLPSGDYALGLEIADRFRDLQAALTRRPQAAAVLRHLASATSHTAYLARIVDGRVAIAQVAEGPDSPHLEDLIPGFDEGAHATALGKALLSTLPPPRRKAYLREAGLRPFTSRTVISAEEFETELASMKRTGTFVEEGQYRSRVSCVALLVPAGEEDEGWEALGFSAPAATFPREREALTTHLRQVAGDLAAA
ncbi:MAG: IclR family transcriptional regulator [Nitriliruptorales bacterium]